MGCGFFLPSVGFFRDVFVVRIIKLTVQKLKVTRVDIEVHAKSTGCII